MLCGHHQTLLVFVIWKDFILNLLYASLLSSINFNLQSTITERRTFHTALEIFRIVNKISPPYLHGIFSYAVDVTGHSGRSAHRLFAPSVRTNYGKQSLAQPLGTVYLKHCTVLKLSMNLKQLYCV